MLDRYPGQFGSFNVPANSKRKYFYMLPRTCTFPTSARTLQYQLIFRVSGRLILCYDCSFGITQDIADLHQYPARCYPDSTEQEKAFR